MFATGTQEGMVLVLSQEAEVMVLVLSQEAGAGRDGAGAQLGLPSS